VHIAIPQAVISEEAHAIRHCLLVGDQSTAVSVAAEVLRRIEAEAPHVSDRTSSLSAVAGAVRLARVLDQPQPVFLGKLHERRRVSTLAVQVDRQHSASGGPQRGGGLRHVHGVRHGVDVYENGGRARQLDREDGWNSGVRHGHDLASRAYTASGEREPDGIGAGAGGYAVSDAAKGRQLSLERFDLRAEDVAPARKDAVDRFIQLLSNRLPLRREVDARNLRGRIAHDGVTYGLPQASRRPVCEVGSKLRPEVRGSPHAAVQDRPRRNIRA
jgi:hypothetical protein